MMRGEVNSHHTTTSTGRPLADLRKQAEDAADTELDDEVPRASGGSGIGEERTGRQLSVTYVDHENMGSLAESLKEKEVTIRTLSRFAWVTCRNNCFVITSFEGIKVKIMKEANAGKHTVFLGSVWDDANKSSLFYSRTLRCEAIPLGLDGKLWKGRTGIYAPYHENVRRRRPRRGYMALSACVQRELYVRSLSFTTCKHERSTIMMHACT